MAVFEQIRQGIPLNISQSRTQERAPKIERLSPQNSQGTGAFQHKDSQVFQAAPAEEFGPGRPGRTSSSE